MVQREQVRARAGGCCEYCQSPEAFATHAFAVEHITPRHLGGTDVRQNLALACDGCNNHKYAKVDAADPVTGETVPLHHPRHMHWRDHFAWNDDASLMLGLTPIGRATIATLQLNRQPLVNLRRVLYPIGEHPPIEPDADRSTEEPDQPGR